MPQLQYPYIVTVDKIAEAAPSTFTMIFDNEEDAIKVKSYLDDPIYRWIIEKTRVSGRIPRLINNFPNAPIEEVLSSDQLSYIQSQL